MDPGASILSRDRGAVPGTVEIAPLRCSMSRHDWPVAVGKNGPINEVTFDMSQPFRCWAALPNVVEKPKRRFRRKFCEMAGKGFEVSPNSSGNPIGSAQSGALAHKMALLTPIWRPWRMRGRRCRNRSRRAERLETAFLNSSVGRLNPREVVRLPQIGGRNGMPATGRTSGDGRDLLKSVVFVVRLAWHLPPIGTTTLKIVWCRRFCL